MTPATPTNSPKIQERRGPLVASLFDLNVEDFGFEPLEVEGNLPAELEGTFYRNGPTNFSTGRSPHVFDGTGAVTAVRIAGGRALGAVRTLHAQSADADAGRKRTRYASWGQPMSVLQMIRGFAGAPSGRNTANVNVFPWQGRLFAMTEASPPLEIDPHTLDTIGETDLDGVVLGAWNAHPHYVPSRRTTYQFGMRIEMGFARRAYVDVYALPDDGNAKLLTSIPIAEPMEVHDFFVTERHLVFVFVPLSASWTSLLRARGAFGTALSWRPERGVEVLVVPIDRPRDVTRIEAAPFFFWHSTNAFEQEDGRRIVLDFIRYPDWPTQGAWIDDSTHGRDGAPHTGRHWRGVLDLAARRATWEPRDDRAVEFPMVHPDWRARSQRFVWSAGFSADVGGRGLTNRLVRLDVERGTSLLLDPGVRGAVGEPTVVPKRGEHGETDAWVLALVGEVDTKSAQLAVWDGARPEDGPIARLRFQRQIGASFHGAWVPAKDSG